MKQIEVYMREEREVYCRHFGWKMMKKKQL